MLVASDTSDISNTIHNLVVVVALSGIGVVLLAAVAAALLTRRGLRPLQRLVVAAGEIERTADPARRLPDPVTVDEIGQLTGVLNRMLASLEQAREPASGAFLPTRRTSCARPSPRCWATSNMRRATALSPRCSTTCAPMRPGSARLVDSLLALEREADPAARELVEPVALDQLARAVASEHDGERVVVGALEPVSVAGDADALRRVINLVENGLVHGPPGGRVTVSVSRWTGGPVLAVADEGAGPAAEHAGHLFERFGAARPPRVGRIGPRAVDRRRDGRPPPRHDRRKRRTISGVASAAASAVTELSYCSY